jgi:hypothetical protein
MTELTNDDIRSLTEIQADIEREAREIRSEKSARDAEIHTRLNQELGASQREYAERLAALNARIRELNESSKGLMPVRPRR